MKEINGIKTLIEKSITAANAAKIDSSLNYDVRLLTVVYDNYFYTLRMNSNGLYFDYRLFNDMLKYLVRMGVDEVLAAAGVINLNNLSANTVDYIEFKIN